MTEAATFVPQHPRTVEFLREIISDAHAALRDRIDDLGPFASRDELTRALEQAGGEPELLDPVSFLSGFILGRDVGSAIGVPLPVSAS